MTRPLRSTDPSRIGDYELIGLVGGGGMGDVFLGRSPGGRLAAVKVMPDLLAGDPRFRERFRREVEAARSVSGAYTAPVLGADPDAERPWLATAYIDGPSLLDRVADEGPLSGPETRRLGAGLAEALRDIHRAGLVHGGLKPGNVLLADDGPRLIDFGIIRTGDGDGLTETGHVHGSAGFMAPEQAAGGEATAATDVYALGALLTYAVTGHGPFGSGPTPGVLLRQASGDRDLSGVPEGLRDVIARCLDILPGARPTTDSLLTLLGGSAIEDAVDLDDSPKPAEQATEARPTGKVDTKATSTKHADPQSQSHASPPRRKVLFFGIAGAAVAAFSVGVAEMPHGDGKTTGAEGIPGGSQNSAGTSTTRSSGLLDGPTKSPLWSDTDVYCDLLALSGNTLLVQGTTLSAFDTATGTRRWTVPTGTFSQNNDGRLPATGDTVYETTTVGGDLVAVAVANGAQTWSAPGPATWLTRGLVGATADVVVGWSYIDTNQPDSNGLWGIDPRSRRLSWSAKIGGIDGQPYFSAETGLVLLSQPHQNQLTAYNLQTGAQAWTAQNPTPPAEAAFATAVASHGTNIYWATNRLHAFDQNGHALWPVGVIGEGADGYFHAVIADDDAVYAALEGAMLGDNVVAAYKASDGAPLWRLPWPESYLEPSLECQLALGGANLYVVDHTSGTLVCVDTKTGKTKWQFHDPAAGKNDSWDVVADDRYVFIGYDSTVRAFAA